MCILEKPFCQICIKGKRSCEGYPDRTFVLDQRTSTATTNLLRISQTRMASPDELAQNPESLQFTLSPHVAHSPLTSILSLSTRAMYREQLLSEFIFSFLPARRQAPRDLNKLDKKFGSWFIMLPSLPDFTEALESTTFAVCTARLGRLNNDSNLVRESLRFYTQGLWELQRALWNPRMMYRDETLAACMTMIIYELIECPQNTSKVWAHHMRGCTTLFKTRGPRAYSSEFGHELFLSFYTLEVQDAIFNGRTTFLSDPAWVEAPWKEFTKSYLHELLEIMAEVAGLLAESDLTFHLINKADGPHKLIPALDILKSCWKVDVKLSSFFKRLDKSTTAPLYWSELSTGFNADIKASEAGCIFPVAFQFTDLCLAQICLSYWATCSILWSGMGFLYRLLTSPLTHSEPQLHFNANDLPQLGNRLDLPALAKNICQSIEFCSQLGSAGTWQTIAIFPLSVAIETLKVDPECRRELEWVQAAMGKISGSGLRIAKNLTSRQS
ncbi:hypothetical protein N431DRAFT_502071 [Stipitochalara longipes BDJ]|nr:hypothetical protein N431DRAFT_502071 [Stipitochalara longipes BDJ]